MDFRVNWKTHLSRQSERSPIYSLCFKPDYSQLIVTCSNDLFFINPENGAIIEQKRSHQSTIYCVRCSYDGTFIASSSADGNIVIWRGSNNEAFVSYGSSSSSRKLDWCPNRQMLISISMKEYNIWKPEETRTIRKPVQYPIESVCFSPSGDVFILTFSNGQVNVFSSETHNILQSFQYSSLVSTIMFSTINDIEYLITSDLDCRVSMYRMSDKTLVGKNSIPFEALCCSSIYNSSFFAFSGVSGKISLMSNKLSYLGDFQTNSEWIWDMGIDSKGRIAIAAQEGYVELRTIHFGISYATAGDYVAFRTNINALLIRNIITKKDSYVTFNKIIISITMSTKFLLVQFKDSIMVYKHEKDENVGKQEPSLVLVDEIPGQFADTMFAITRINIISAEKSIITFYDLTGQRLCQYSFSCNISYLSYASLFNDGGIAGLDDGRVFFMTYEMKDPIILAKHNSPIKIARRSGNLVGVLDYNHILAFFDVFNRKITRQFENIHTFSFNDRSEELFVISDGIHISVYFKEYYPCVSFIEGDILGFTRNKIVISHNGAFEIVDVQLPISQMIIAKDWESLFSLINIGLSNEELLLISKEAIKAHQFDLARLAAPQSDIGISFFAHHILNSIPISEVDTHFSKYLGKDSPIVDSLKEDNSQKTIAQQLEESGASEDAINMYAKCGEWNDVLRIASDKHLERSIVDIEFPSTVSEKAAKVMLNAGLGEGAVRLLSKCKNIDSLAKTHIYLGQWPEAISLSRIYSYVYEIIYPRFGQLLFESGHWFESLICFFIPKNRENRGIHFQKMIELSSEAKASHELSFLYLMVGFNDPISFWKYHIRSIAYSAANRLRNYTIMAMSKDDAMRVFYLSYYVLAVLNEYPLIGVNAEEIVLQLLLSSTTLGAKRWVSYSLGTLTSYNPNSKVKQIAQRAARAIKDIEQCHVSFQCPKCKKDFYSSSKAPLLSCGNCGIRISFSSFSCQPLPLIPVNYSCESPMKYISIEPYLGLLSENPGDMVSEAFLQNTPPERFVIQRIKEKANVKPQIWFNSNLINTHICCNCGSVFNDFDYEYSVLENEKCPICHSLRILESEQINEEIQSDILEMLRPLEEESIVTF